MIILPTSRVYWGSKAVDRVYWGARQIWTKILTSIFANGDITPSAFTTMTPSPFSLVADTKLYGTGSSVGVNYDNAKSKMKTGTDYTLLFQYKIDAANTTNPNNITLDHFPAKFTMYKINNVDRTDYPTGKDYIPNTGGWVPVKIQFTTHSISIPSLESRFYSTGTKTIYVTDFLLFEGFI